MVVGAVKALPIPVWRCLLVVEPELLAGDEPRLAVELGQAGTEALDVVDLVVLDSVGEQVRCARRPPLTPR